MEFGNLPWQWCVLPMKWRVSSFLALQLLKIHKLLLKLIDSTKIGYKGYFSHFIIVALFRDNWHFYVRFQNYDVGYMKLMCSLLWRYSCSTWGWYFRIYVPEKTKIPLTDYLSNKRKGKLWRIWAYLMDQHLGVYVKMELWFCLECHLNIL